MAIAAAGAASAQSETVPANWPDRPLRMIVPLPAGSAVDVIARLISQRLSARLGQPVMVENRAGASGMIGADMVAKAAPDGYTLGMATSTTHMTAPVLNAKLPYDPVKDFAPVAVVGISPYVLVVNPKVPANNVAELIALAKAKPKTLSYSSVGNASQAHLAGELFATMAGVELNHIPYKTSTHAVIDLNEGRIDMQFGILGTSLVAHPRGQASRARGDHRTAARGTARCADHDRVRLARLRCLAAVRRRHAGRQRRSRSSTRLNREINDIMATPEVKRVLAAQAIHVDVEHAGSACASASPRKSSSGAASRRRPASSRSDSAAPGFQPTLLKARSGRAAEVAPVTMRRDGLRSTTMVRGADAGPVNTTDDLTSLRIGAILSKAAWTSSYGSPHQRSRDFGLLVDFVGQALGGGDRLRKRRRFLPNAAGAVLGLPGFSCCSCS